MYGNNNFSNFHLDNGARVNNQGAGGHNFIQKPCWQLDVFKDSVFLKMNNSMVNEILHTLPEVIPPALSDMFGEIRSFLTLSTMEVIIDDKEQPFMVGRYGSAIFVVMNHQLLKEFCFLLSNLNTVLLSSTYSLKQKMEKIMYNPPTTMGRPNY